MPSAVEASLSTSSSLIERVRKSEPEGWKRLVELYGPLVYRWSRQAGLQADDAADVVQDTFRTVLAGIVNFRHQESNSSFLGWLRTIVHSRVIDHFRRAARQPVGKGGSTVQMQLAETPDSVSDSSVASGMRDHLQVLRMAAEALQHEFQPATWKAFWRVTVDGAATDEVASELRLSVAAIRQANYRVRRRLREELQGLWEITPSPLPHPASAPNVMPRRSE